MSHTLTKTTLNQSFDDIRVEFGACTMEVARKIYHTVNYAKRNPKYGLKRNDLMWFYQTVEALSEELQRSKSQIKRAIKNLIEAGYILKEKFWACRGSMVNFYTFVMKSISQKMSQSFAQNEPMYIQPLLTNKNINKSRSYPQVEQVNQVEQVQNILNSSFEEEKKPLTTTAQDMLKIWNEKFGKKAPDMMSKELAPRLVSAYNTKFGQDLQKWKGYCDLIKSSSYLMGKEFELYLEWALKFYTIDKIYEGKYGVKRDKIEFNGIEALMVLQEDEMLAEIDKLHEAEEIKVFRRNLVGKLGAAEYRSWFHSAFFTQRNGEVQMLPANDFVAQKWEERYRDIERR